MAKGRAYSDQNHPSILGRKTSTNYHGMWLHGFGFLALQNLIDTETANLKVGLAVLALRGIWDEISLGRF